MFSWPRMSKLTELWSKTAFINWVESGHRSRWCTNRGQMAENNESWKELLSALLARIMRN